ncbi:MAG: GIY-YIG nuclease family protein [Rhodospirillaceae bacterium]|nr:GIY-YIG nuclease family protein [Rhodospirillaceae bacterium]
MTSPQPPTCVYMLRCADGSFYTGLTRRPMEERLSEHNSGAVEGYTTRRRPVELVWCEEFHHATDAIAAERRIKKWSRRKKIALIRGDWDALKQAAKKNFKRPG